MKYVLAAYFKVVRFTVNSLSACDVSQPPCYVPASFRLEEDLETYIFMAFSPVGKEPVHKIAVDLGSHTQSMRQNGFDFGSDASPGSKGIIFHFE